MKAYEEKNVEDLEGLLYNYNKITPFDKLKTNVLVKVKQLFQKEGGQLEGGLS